MQIVLSILHFLGWILLVVLCLLIVGLLIILFLPARYLIDIYWREEKKAKFYVYWLFHLVRAKITYSDDLIYCETLILGKKHTFSYDLTEKKEHEPKKMSYNEKKGQIKEEGIISKIKGMIERIKRIYPKLKKIIMDEKNKEAVTHFKNEIIYLLKILLPKKSKVDVVYSTGSPDTTGQSFGIIACFPGVYQKSWKIIPDFLSDDMYFKGIIYGKGRLYGYELIGIILRILFDKNCMRLYTIVNKFIKWVKKEEHKSEGNCNG